MQLAWAIFGLLGVAFGKMGEQPSKPAGTVSNPSTLLLLANGTDKLLLANGADKLVLNT